MLLERLEDVTTSSPQDIIKQVYQSNSGINISQAGEMDTNHLACLVEDGRARPTRKS
jgi:hypothetical protein